MVYNTSIYYVVEFSLKGEFSKGIFPLGRYGVEKTGGPPRRVLTSQDPQ
jgi:hypothetical protein